MGVIYNNKFYTDEQFKKEKLRLMKMTDQFVEYRNDADKLKHKKDLIQPYTKQGLPNPEFIRAYPEKSLDYFDERTVRERGNL